MYKLICAAILVGLLFGCAGGIPTNPVPDNYDAELESRVELFLMEQLFRDWDYY